MEKKWTVFVEIPDGWLDAESPIVWAAPTVRDEVVHRVKKQVVELITNGFPIPEIEIPEEEIREAVKLRIVEKLAERAMSN